MLNELKEILANLEKTAIFSKWKQEHDNAFLSSCFIVDSQGWQIAFYSPVTKKASTFLKDQLVQSDSPIFRLKTEKMEKLDLNDVKLELEDAFSIADKELEEKHPGYKTNKKIIVLQKLDGVVVWNLTYLTTSFYIFNIKINAANKKIVSEDFVSAMYNNPKKNSNLP